MFAGKTILWNEYLLVLQLSAEVSEEIKVYKDAFKRTYDFPNAIVTRPHLTLMKFFQYESYEELIIKKIQQLSETVQPFDVQLKDFGTFHHTIYVEVKTVRPILELVHKRKNELKPFLNEPKYVFITKKPHITIVRGLMESQCRTAWQHWCFKRYQRTFKAVHMTLLRRQSDHVSYEKISTFHFKGLPYPYIQTTCF